MGIKNELYKKAVLKQLYFNDTMSCAEISSQISKSIPVTLKILEELVKEGVVVETGFAPSSGGRRPLMYALKEGRMYMISVAMDQLITRIAVMDIHNKPVGEVEKFELPLQNNSKALSLLIKKIESVISSSTVNKRKIIGVGIGMPGFIDFEKGINYTFLETGGKTVSRYISGKIKLPVYIDNDSSLIALAELRFGCAYNKKNVMVVNMGWGIGLGMILNGELFRGSDGFAGEFSHIPIFNNNKLCECGKTGCLETETSLMVLIEKAKQGLQAGRLSVLGKNFPTGFYEQDYEAINAAALKGDQFVVELFSEAGYNIGLGVAVLIHLLNPEIIVLSGRGSMAGKIWEAPIQNALNEHCIPRLSANTTIRISSFGHEAELIGAAILVMENMEKRMITNDVMTVPDSA
jgi:predicted NBD/HSP70 family sugar kinase